MTFTFSASTSQQMDADFVKRTKILVVCMKTSFSENRRATVLLNETLICLMLK